MYFNIMAISIFLMLLYVSVVEATHTYVDLQSSTYSIMALGMVGCEFKQLQSWKRKYFKLVRNLVNCCGKDFNY